MEAQSQNEYTELHVTEVPRAVNFIRQWLVGVGCEGEEWGVVNEDLGKVLEMDGGASAMRECNAADLYTQKLYGGELPVSCILSQ